jgi:hypothetical protein
MRDQSRHSSVEESIEQAFGFLAYNNVSRYERLIKELPTVLVPIYGLLLQEPTEQRLDRVVVPIDSFLHTLDDLSHGQRGFVPQRLEHY